jgi:hypothetical protein
MDEEKAARYEILKACNEAGKFAVAMGCSMPDEQQQAFEAMQVEGWISLIDVSPLWIDDRPGLYRIFLASKDAMTWFRQQG